MIKIYYKDETTRIINVQKEFFLDRSGKYRSVETVREEAKQMAYNYGRKVYRVVVVRDNKIIVNFVDKYNKPYKHPSSITDVEIDSVEIKALKKKFKHSEFTVKCDLRGKILK